MTDQTDAAGPSPREIIRHQLWRDPDVKESLLDHLTDQIIAALESAGYRIVPDEQRAGVVERATIERGVMDGYDAAGFRWDEKLREYDGQLDGHDAYAVIVTSITDAVLAEIEKSRATGDGET
jgi:hypothetical protein